MTGHIYVPFSYVDLDIDGIINIPRNFWSKMSAGQLINILDALS